MGCISQISSANLLVAAHSLVVYILQCVPQALDKQYKLQLYHLGCGNRVSLHWQQTLILSQNM